VLEPKYKLDVETDSAGSESACALEGPDAPLGMQTVSILT
jgi:hypothetical protein